MLAVSPLRSNKDGLSREGDTAMSEASFAIGSDDFPDFSGGNLLDSIDFDDLFMGMQDGDVLPDLEMDPELLAEFSLSGGEESEANNSSSAENNAVSPSDDGYAALAGDGFAGSTDKNDVSSGKDDRRAETDANKLERESSEEEESERKKDRESDATTTVNSWFKESDRGKRSSSSSTKSAGNNSNKDKDNQGKRKAKVDWTPELHRRFVQAVEQLGVDKAVPSRILELMGIDCLTRHNIASHLQKYRSHRKHLLAREAEAATWTQKRQMYGVAVGGGKGGGPANMGPWHPPTLGFPPMTTMHHHHPFRPLHVWGHPTMVPQARMPVWPKQAIAPPATSIPPPVWTPPPPHDPSFWHAPHQRVPNAITPAGAPCFPQPLPTGPATRFAAPPVPGIPPHAMYRPEPGGIMPPPAVPPPGAEFHPSKESIDAAIGDALAKPWQPLPIGLKPPSIDSVLVELQRQGVPKIPPTCA